MLFIPTMQLEQCAGGGFNTVSIPCSVGPPPSSLPRYAAREQNVLHPGGRSQSPSELFILSRGEAAACLATRDEWGGEGEGLMYVYAWERGWRVNPSLPKSRCLQAGGHRSKPVSRKPLPPRMYRPAGAYMRGNVPFSPMWRWICIKMHTKAPAFIHSFILMPT